MVGRRLVTDTEEALGNPVGIRGRCLASQESNEDTKDNQMRGQITLPPKNSIPQEAQDCYFGTCQSGTASVLAPPADENNAAGWQLLSGRPEHEEVGKESGRRSGLAWCRIGTNAQCLYVPSAIDCVSSLGSPS